MQLIGTEWPQEALRSVANHFLDKVEMSKELKRGVGDICVQMQQTASEMTKTFRKEMGRHYYVTPTSYLALINTFKKLISTKQSEITTKKSRYENGLQKLRETADQVANMRAELEALQPKLKEAQAETEKQLGIVEARQKEADAKKKVVEEDEKVAMAQKEACLRDKAECEEMLAVAIPTLNEALKALKTLSKSDIVEVKAMKKPPAGVKLTMEAVCIMMA